MKTIISKIESRRSFYKGTDPLKNKYPWLTFGAIIFLESIIKPDFKVIEFGSGGSTLFFSSRVKEIKSYETNESWYKNVSEKIKKIDNVELIYSDRKTMSNGIKKEKDNSIDIILVDTDPARSKRIDLANLSKNKVKIGGYLILDNYQKFGLSEFDYTNFDVFTFDEEPYTGKGTRICRRLV